VTGLLAVSLFALCVSLALSLALLFRLLPIRNVQSISALIMADIAILIWIIGYLLEILVPDVTTKLFWAKVQYFGIAFTPALFLIFILQYIGRITRIDHIQILALSLLPLMTVLIAATNESHSWLWTEVGLQPGGLVLAPLNVIHGGWFWVHTLYSYVLIFLATFFLAKFAFFARQPFRSQAVIMLVGMLVPWLANALYIFQVHLEPGLDLTPIAFAITIGMLTLGFLRFGLLDILPIAHATIFKAMIDGVIILDLKDRVVDINPAAWSIFQQIGELKIGDAIRPLLPNWPRHLPVEILRQEICLGEGQDYRTYTLQISPITNNRGRTTGQIALLTDITELKRAQSQMILQATALNSAENGIMITDPLGEIEWVNLAFTRLTGYQYAEVVGQNARILKSGKHPPSFYHNLWHSLRAGKMWRGEMINRRKDGSLYYEEMTLTPLRDGAGETAHVIAIKQNITERKETEEVLKLANAEVLEASLLKTQLLANVSHELRTPLSAVVGFAEMLNAGVYGSVNLQQSKVLDDILDSSNQLLLLVNNLIDRTQIEEGKITLKQTRFQISDLVEAAETSVSVLADQKELRLEYEVDLNLPHTLIGDIYWLRQIVINLMVNAVKFTGQGFVRFRLWKRGADTWTIEVTDTGIGIPPDAADKIFEPFHQIDSSETRAQAGSGLGLSIVRELVYMMGGTIRFESDKGVGSCFIVCLPLIQGD